jgi:4-aminobutyrate aminotransferase-like enzyme
VRIAPPLTVSAEQIDEALDILDHALAAVHETMGVN